MAIQQLSLTIMMLTVVIALVAVIVGQQVHVRRIAFSQPCSSSKDPSISFQVNLEDLSLVLEEDESSIPKNETFFSVKVDPCHVFSDSYVEARETFRSAASKLRGRLGKDDVQLFSIPVVPERDYTIDIVLLHGTKPGLVVHSSGVHGVEGFAGSAVQIAFLENIFELMGSGPLSISNVVLVHAVNPSGMANYRRTNENNVDLNRNGIVNWSKTSNHPNHATYKKFDASLFNPTGQQPDVTTFWLKAVVSIAQHGFSALKAAMVGGQYYNPQGIFYGGSNQVEASIRLLEEWFRDTYLAGFEQKRSHDVLTWIDVHTGLGQLGNHVLMHGNSVGNSDSPHNAAADDARWFPSTSSLVHDDGQEAKDVSKGYDESTGFVIEYMRERLFTEWKDASLLAQEFGTIAAILVGHALVTENAAFHYYQRRSDLSPQEREAKAIEWAQRTTQRAFYPQNVAWRHGVLVGGLRVLHQAIQRSIALSLTKEHSVDEQDDETTEADVDEQSLSVEDEEDLDVADTAGNGGDGGTSVESPAVKGSSNNENMESGDDTNSTQAEATPVQTQEEVSESGKESNPEEKKEERR